MDPVALVLTAGLSGGVIVAFIMFRVQAPPTSVDPLRKYPITTDVINMARIRVSGLGGFGLMMMTLAVAAFVPRIRQHILIGAVLGIALATALILLRRRNGPMPSSGETPGANTMFGLDQPSLPLQNANGDRPGPVMQHAPV